ncbi:hypothetical protein A8F94_05810 [Bacillus sp. FJAT-27225]|nr:hypothetical protein A8F94_05810 [Bacillus sp. FJAT-27225]
MVLRVDWSGRCELVRKCIRRIFSCGAFSGKIIQRPAGQVGQVRPRSCFSNEEAHRPPRGKRASRSGNQLLHKTTISNKNPNFKTAPQMGAVFIRIDKPDGCNVTDLD